MKKTSTRLTALALSLALLLTSCGGGASATSMHLRKTEGTVGVSDGEGKDVTPKENLGLYSGYQVGTQAESYAWIDLDRVKLTKMDAGSEIEIIKDGKKLEIDVKSGSLFFNVTEPLASDETMDIVTSTMMIGIRGTCGWVTENTAALLEGTVSVTAGDQEVTVTAGEMAVLSAEGTLEVKPFTAASVPAFVREEVAEDEKLAKAIQDTTGIDLTGADPMAAYEELLSTLENVVYSELIDFEQDGSPELLVSMNTDYDDGTDRNLLLTQIYKNTPAGPAEIGQFHDVISSGFKISLIECDGRYLFGTTYEDSYGPNSVYWGLTWNATDGAYMWREEVVSHYYGDDFCSVSTLDEQGNRVSYETLEEYEAIMARYREVKVLVYGLDDVTAVAAEP